MQRFAPYWSAAPEHAHLGVLLPLFSLDRAGMPVGQFGPWLTLGLAVAAAILHGVFHGVFPWRALLPFRLTLFSLFVIGWPLFKLGFGWLGFANDNPANYARFAQRLLLNHHFTAPIPKQFASGTNYRQVYILNHILDEPRSGANCFRRGR